MPWKAEHQFSTMHLWIRDSEESQNSTHWSHIYRQIQEGKVHLAVFTNGFPSPPSDNVEICVSSPVSVKYGRPSTDCKAEIITWDETEVKRRSGKNKKCVPKKFLDTASRLREILQKQVKQCFHYRWSIVLTAPRPFESNGAYVSGLLLITKLSQTPATQSHSLLSPPSHLLLFSSFILSPFLPFTSLLS